MNLFTTKAYLFLIIFLLFAATGAIAQPSTGELPYSIRYNLDLAQITESIHLSQQKQAYYETVVDKFEDLAGFSIPAGKKFSELATSTLLPDGTSLWHMKLSVENAQYLGLVFSDFQIPSGDKMFIINGETMSHIGAFTDENNLNHGFFSTHVMEASTLIIEYYTTSTQRSHLPGFFLEEIIYIYPESGIRLTENQIKSSGACNVNINCPEGDAWKKQKRGVVRILLRSGNSWFNCTGSLVNNTRQDGKPYFLTADHCGAAASADDLAVWQFYFNNEFPSCANTGHAPTNMMITGSELLAKAPISQGTDFKLLLLNSTPSLTWNPYYNGWSRSSDAPQWGTCIHHPLGDKKNISTYNSPATDATFTGGMTQGYWRVVWVETQSGHGVTEGGSSGSPLFDHNGLIRGTLTGGSASCTNLTLPDFYGKFSHHWQANGETNDRKLSPWLDPDNLNPEELYGFDPNLATNFVTTQISPPASGDVKGAGFFAENETVTLTATSNEGFVFNHWINNNGQIVSTNKEYTFTMGQIQINLTAVFSIFNDLLIPDRPLENLTIYPNPASDRFSVNFEGHQGKARITIVDQAGRFVKKVYLTDIQTKSQQVVSVEGLTPGFYLISTSVDQSVYNHKILLLP